MRQPPDAFDRARTCEAEGDLKTARRAYREAAEAGHPAAAVLLGGLLATERVRSVRNQCAHPAERGWPAPYEVDLALSIAEALRRRVG